MYVALASDCYGFETKERIKLLLVELGCQVDDLSPRSDAATDLVATALALAAAVGGGSCDRGLLVGRGQAGSIAANRHPGIRCAIGWDVPSAQAARAEYDANLLALDEGAFGVDDVSAIVEAWLETRTTAGHSLACLRQMDRSRNGHSCPQLHGTLQHSVECVQFADAVCNACGEEFSVPIDILAGSVQGVIEECPVCDHENVIGIEIDEAGRVRVAGGTRSTG